MTARLRRIVSALRTPLVLAALAIGMGLTTNFAGMDPRLLNSAELAARLLIVVALGVAALQLGLLWLDRRFALLDLQAVDNLAARRRATRLKVLRRIWLVAMVVVIFAAALTTIPWARQIGISVFASAGIAGLAIGIAAQPVLSNVIAGLQIAFSQPIRIDDAVVVEGEWGWIEEIGLFHVVVRIWDLRRLVVPLKYFIDQPFQNWTRETAAILGPVTWELDYSAPVAAMRSKLDEIVREHPLWDGEVLGLQVIDAREKTIQVRALMGARNSGDAWTLRCDVREAMIDWLQRKHPEALPRVRTDADGPGAAGVEDTDPAMDPP